MSQIQTRVQILCALFLVIAIACVIVGKKLCGEITYKGQTYGMGGKNSKCVKFSEITVKDWKRASQLDGQYFVLVASLILIIATIIMIITGPVLKILPKVVAVAISGFAVIMSLICFGLEIWYATGFGVLSTREYVKGDLYTMTAYVESYIAAAFFYGVVIILCIIDTAVTVNEASDEQDYGDQPPDKIMCSASYPNLVTNETPSPNVMVNDTPSPNVTVEYSAPFPNVVLNAVPSPNVILVNSADTSPNSTNYDNLGFDQMG